jgi:hypothetical protein
MSEGGIGLSLSIVPTQQGAKPVNMASLLKQASKRLQRGQELLKQKVTLFLYFHHYVHHFLFSILVAMISHWLAGKEASGL